MIMHDLFDCEIMSFDENFRNRTVGCIVTNTEEAIKNKDNSPLFICINGTKYDTHKDIEMLILEGIKDIVVEIGHEVPEIADDVNIIYSKNTRKTLALASKCFYKDPGRKLTIIGLTGTKGKTTVSYMLESVLHEAGIKCGIIGTNGIIFNNQIHECENSTPGANEYYRYLKEMSDHGITHVICEVTSQSLKQYRTYGTTFEIAAFTNLYPDHIGKDEHSDFEEYRLYKSTLFESCRKAVLNMDDPNSTFFADKCLLNDIDFVYFSLQNTVAEYYCSSSKTKCISSKFRYSGKVIAIPLPGDFNIQNAMCAISILEELGLKMKHIIKGLAKVKVPGRCESVANPAGINIIIDYAHNKESLENILSTLKKDCRGKLYCVFGAGGDRSKLRRGGMGEAASKFADYSVITSDNPRTEDPDDIIKDILQGIPSDYKNYTVFPERQKAIYHILAKAKKGDTVLLAGKGAQNYEEICGIKYPFDERETVSQYYKNKITRR